MSIDEQTVLAPAVENSGSPAETAAAPSRSMFYARVAAIGLLVVSAVAAVWFGVGWVRAGFFTDVPRAHAREAALDGARQAAVNMSTLSNPDDPDAMVRLVESSVTGDLLSHVQGTADELKQTAKAADQVVSGTVVDASVTQLNSELDKADVLVVLNQTQTPRDGRPGLVQQIVWLMNMRKTSGGWKAEQTNSLNQPLILGGAGNPAAAPAPTGAQPTPAPTGQPQPTTPKAGS
jgi:Mce-associated membrane protein